MGIELLTKNGQIGLAAKCDLCGERVSAINSNVIWFDDNWEDGVSHHYEVACKVNSKGIHCSKAIELSAIKTGIKNVMMTELDVSITELIENTGADLKSAYRRARFLQGIGH
jgi:hypothetical protein